MDDAERVGRLLAERHREPAKPDPVRSLMNYAESQRTGDWSLRSALVRLAQPEPTRAGALLELVRRTDGALHPLARELERHTVHCDRGLTTATIDEVIDRYADGRAVDLARIAADAPAMTPLVVEAYEAASDSPLDDTERAAVPLVVAALALDALAVTLCDWAPTAPATPPVADVDGVCGAVFGLLADIGVPRETGPPNRRGRRERGA